MFRFGGDFGTSFQSKFRFLDLFVIVVDLVFVCVRFGLSRTLRIICRLLAFAFYNGGGNPRVSCSLCIFVVVVCAGARAKWSTAR